MSVVLIAVVLAASAALALAARGVSQTRPARVLRPRRPAETRDCRRGTQTKARRASATVEPLAA
jgi:hypothetical protein